MKGWIRADPNRTKSQVFICPYCRRTAYQAYKKTAGGECEYRFCPHCGEEVRKEDSLFSIDSTERSCNYDKEER